MKDFAVALIAAAACFVAFQILSGTEPAEQGATVSGAVAAAGPMATKPVSG